MKGVAHCVIATPTGNLMAAVNPGAVWHVGHRPDPWAWTPWEYAGDDGRFHGRWDDPAGRYRTLYAGGDRLHHLVWDEGRRPDA